MWDYFWKNRPISISEKGIFVLYDSQIIPDSEISTIPNHIAKLQCLNKNNKEHIITFEQNSNVIQLFVTIDDKQYCYVLNSIESEQKSSFEEKFKDVPKYEIETIIIPRSNARQYLAQNAIEYTISIIDNIRQLKDCITIFEEIRKKEEEQKEIQEQIDLWSLCIEAEQKLLNAIDLPFFLDGAPIVKKKHAEINILPYAIADSEESLNIIREICLDYSIKIDNDGRIGLTKEQIEKITEIENNKQYVIEIKNDSAYCKVTIEGEYWAGGKFKQEQREKRHIYCKFDRKDYNVFEFEIRNTIPKIIQWLKDINSFEDFYDEIEIEDTKIWTSVHIKIRESEEKRDERLRSLSGKEIRDGKDYNSILLGTLDYNNSNYKRLRLLFPKNEEDAEKAIKCLNNDVINIVYPFLKKDIELLRREKSAMDKISSNDENKLKNDKLRDFIFNSSKASPTKEIEEINDITKTVFYSDCQRTKLLDLNQSQQEAIVKGVLAKDLFLLQGPPGTGKTTVISELIWQHIRRCINVKIMLTSQTNLAIDNALSRLLSEFTSSYKNEMWRYKTLIKPIRIADNEVLEDEGKPFTPERINDWINGNNDAETQNNVVNSWLQNIANRIEPTGKYVDILQEWKNSLMNPDKNMRLLFGNAYKKDYNILGMTCGKVDSSDFRKCNGEDGFDIVIIDEASKATPPELLMPLCYAKKSIIIGDHRQLPPVIREDDYIRKLKGLKTKRAEEIANRLDKDLIKKSLFKKLITNPELSPTIKSTLNIQYRMHSQINEVIEQFYKDDDGGLHCGLNPLQINDANLGNKESRYHGLKSLNFINPIKHVIWIDVPDGQQRVEGTSLYNDEEVTAIHLAIEKLVNSEGFCEYINFWKENGNIESYITEAEIGIISFYAAQVRKINSKVQSFCDKNKIKFKVRSVDRFQGQERGIVIVSTVCTRGEGGFTKTPERLNVALSRARRLLIIVGNSKFYMNIKDENNNYLYRNVIEIIKKNNSFIDYKEILN